MLRAKRNTHALDESGPDLRTFGVQGNGYRSVLKAALSKALSGFTHILDGFSMVLRNREESLTEMLNQAPTTFYICQSDYTVLYWPYAKLGKTIYILINSQEGIAVVITSSTVTLS